MLGGSRLVDEQFSWDVSVEGSWLGQRPPAPLLRRGGGQPARPDEDMGPPPRCSGR